MKADEGTDLMKKIAGAVRKGANAYLKRQYTGVAIFFAVMFVILLILPLPGSDPLCAGCVPDRSFFSALSGFIGMKIATNSNARTAQAAYEGLNKGLRVAFSSGSVMGFTVVGLGMLDVTMWFCILHFAFGITDPVEPGNIMVMNGMGASFMALFARVGGGIYTKAADVAPTWSVRSRPVSPKMTPVTPLPCRQRGRQRGRRGRHGR